MIPVGGFLPFSVSDYPGHPCAVVFTQGCNYRCPFCHNGQLLPMEPGCVDVPEMLARLDDRRAVLRAVTVSGGEPTVHTALPAFCEELKRRSLSVKLDTNGSRPEALSELLKGALLDYVAMDVKAPLRKYRALAGARVDTASIEKCAAAVADSGVPHHFRTTAVPALLSDGDLAEIREMLPDGSPYVVQDFKPEHALDPALRSTASRETGPSAG